MKELHILVTGVGRRVELMKAFRLAALKNEINLKIYGADMLGNAPALAYCDHTRKVVSMRDESYISDLLRICKNDKIDLVLPTIDTDLLVLSKNVDLFEKIGTKVLISKTDKIMICRDKNNTGDFFELCGLKAPKTYNDYKRYDDRFPCFIKPKDGSSSINAFKVETKEELETYANQVDDYIVQPFIEGKEYTVDIFCDFDGNPIYITPRQRIQVRAGEVLKTLIVDDEIIVEECKKLIEKFKPCGPMTVQLIRDNKTGDDYYIEINPRYGGGAPLSMKSGAVSAEALLKMLVGKKVDYVENAACCGDVFSRFDDSVCISHSIKTRNIKGVIFDLDDTLYPEKQYVKSGYNAVEEYLQIDNAAQRMWQLFEEGKPAIDEFLRENGITDKKDGCLKAYRNHIPSISFYDGVTKTIKLLKDKGIKIGMITDGRVEGQQNKIEALNAYEIFDDIIITDSLGGVQFRKPNDISFRIMQNRWKLSFEEIVYVGDNASKDFQAPKQLGMQSIYFKNKDGLYFENSDENAVDNRVESINEILDLIL